MRKSLKIAAIVLPLLFLAVGAGLVTKINTHLSRRFTEHLPSLMAKIPAVSSYSHEGVRYNFLTDTLTINGAVLELSGRPNKVAWKSLKVRGLRRRPQAEADGEVIKSAKLKGLRLETTGKTPSATLVCREFEIERLILPQLSIKQLILSRRLNFARLAAKGFEGRVDWNDLNLFNLSFDHLELLGQAQSRLELGRARNVKLAVERHNVDLGALVVRNLVFASSSEAVPDPWPWWPVGLDLLEIRQAVWGGFSKTPWSVNLLTFKGRLEPGRWPERADLQVKGASILGDWQLSQLLGAPVISFKAVLSRESEPGLEVARLVVNSGQLKKCFKWAADVKMVTPAPDSAGAESLPAAAGLAWARLDLREDGLGRRLANGLTDQSALQGDQLKIRLYLNAWARSLQTLDNTQELLHIWKIFAQPGSAKSLTVTAAPEQPWPLRLTMRQLLQPGEAVNELGLNVRLTETSESWPIKFKD